MHPATIPDREATEQQAALWTARLETGALTEADRHELAAWLDAHPDRRVLLTRYRELHAMLREQLPVLADAAEADALIASVAARHRRWRWAGRALAVAATIALMAAAWRMLPETMVTHSAERRALALADGSRLELNAQTSLEIALGRRERRVTLTRGEALFRVAPSAGQQNARPFVVTTPAGTVRVTGTVFNVRVAERSSRREEAGLARGVEVTVLEGTVQVRPASAEADAPVPLAPNDQAMLAGTRVTVRTLSPDAAQNVIAWRVGQAAFESEPLAAALERFAAYHSRAITVSPDAAALRVGGRYSLDDLDGFLAAIEQALPIGVVHGADGAVRVVARPRAKR